MTGWRDAERRRPGVRRNPLAGTRPDHAGPSGSGPRCRKPVAAYEVRGVPAISGETVPCGRPAGHGGQCYSEAAWRRKLAANAAGVLAARARKREEADVAA
jgi:hypothetical protein